MGKTSKTALCLIIISFLCVNTDYCFQISPDKFSDKYTGTYISEPSTLLGGEKPKAKWIWDNGNINPLNYYLLIRKEVILEKLPRKITSYISAYSFADVYINGKLIDRCPVNCDPEYQVYEHYDITRFFKKGRNIISAVVYNYGTGMHHRINARGGFFFQGKINYKNGKQTEILSDKNWKVFHTDAWQNSADMRTGSADDSPHLIGFNERFTASILPEFRNTESMNVKGWENAFEIGIPPVKPWNSIVEIKRPALQREKVLLVKNWRSKNYIVYDFGREISASPVFEIESEKAGINLELGTGERLNSDSTVITKKRVNYTDNYITTKGVQIWSPSTWRGLRYFTIEQNDNIKIKNVFAETRGYKLVDEGEFECSDTLLNKIWEIGKYSIRLCAQDTYMDTPWREQTQYIGGDARYIQKYAFYAFGGSSNFLSKYNLLCGAQSQRWSNEGAVRSRYPTDWLLGPNSSAYLPDYELEWILMAGEYYKLFGDLNLVKRIYPNVKKLLNYFSRLESADHGLIKNAPGWIVLDHPRNYPIDLKEEITALNCLYYESLKQAAFLSSLINPNKSDSLLWSKKAAEVKESINKWLWCEEKGLFRDSYGSNKFSPQTQVYSLLYGLADSLSTDKLIDYIAGNGKCSEQSFAYYVLYSVFDKKPDWALDFIRSNWGEQMKSPYFNGSWHEAWNIAAWKGDVGSASHAWSSGPTALLPQKILGAEPKEAGWKSFTIKPVSANLEWAKGTIPSPNGKIEVDWKKQEKRFDLNVEIPKNTTGYIYLPARDNSEVMINGKLQGFITSKYGVEKVPGYIKLKLQAGKYSLTSMEKDK